MMRTLWIFNHYAAPPMGRHQALAAALTHHGWNTCILAASTSRPPDIHATSTELDGVSCRWVRSSGYSGNGAGRFANMFTYTANSTALVVARNGLPRPDVVWGSTVHPGAPVAGLAVARRFKTPFIYEVRDLWPETFVAMGRLKRRSPVARVLYGVESHLAARADLILSPLGGVGTYFSERYGIDESKFQCIPNGIQAARIVTSQSVKTHSRRPKTTFTFAGSMGHVNGLDLLLDAFTDHAHGYEDSILNMVGDGPKRGELERLVRTRGLEDRVRFKGWVPFEQVPAQIAASDWTVAVVDDLPDVFRYGISYVKMPEYMAAGRPLLLAANTSDDLVRLSGGGISVLPNKEALAKAFTTAALSTAEERQAMAMKGRDYVLTNLTYEALAEELMQSLDRLYDGVAR